MNWWKACKQALSYCGSPFQIWNGDFYFCPFLCRIGT